MGLGLSPGCFGFHNYSPHRFANSCYNVLFRSRALSSWFRGRSLGAFVMTFYPEVLRIHCLGVIPERVCFLCNLAMCTPSGIVFLCFIGLPRYFSYFGPIPNSAMASQTPLEMATLSLQTDVPQDWLCNSCKARLPLASFYSDGGVPKSRCKVCCKAWVGLQREARSQGLVAELKRFQQTCSQSQRSAMLREWAWRATGRRNRRFDFSQFF